MTRRQYLMFFVAPALFILSRCLYFYFLNIGEFTVFSAVRSLVVLLITTILFQFLAWKLFGCDSKKSNLFIFIILIFSFSFGKIESLLIMNFSNITNKILCIFIFVFFILFLFFLVHKIKRVPVSLGKLLFTCSLFLSIYPIASYYFRDNGNVGKRYEFYSPEKINAKTRPNLYIVLLDAYSRKDILKEIYGFDNSDFINFLERNEFYISPGSMSNYVWTSLSIPSFLNMNYADKIFSDDLKVKYDSVWANKAINNNNIARYLNNYGYKYLDINSGVIFTENDMPGVETLYSPYTPRKNLIGALTMPINGLERLILSRTIFGIVGKDYLLEDEYEQHRDHVQKSLFALQRSSELPGTKVVFAHILSPHHPFVFDQNGNKITPKDSFVLGEGGTKSYTDQLQYLNSQMKKVIEKIIKNDPSSVILLVSDHGGRNFLDDKKNISETNLRDCFPNFVAIRSPEKKNNKKYENISLVNVLRVFLKTYFDSNITLLPDQYFFNNKVVELTDVSDKLKSSTRE